MLVGSGRGGTPEKRKARECDQHPEPQIPTDDPQILPQATEVDQTGPRVTCHDWKPGIYPVEGRFTVVFEDLGFLVADVALLKQGKSRWFKWPTRIKVSGGKAMPRIGGGYIETDLVGFLPGEVGRTTRSAIAKALAAHIREVEGDC